MEASILMWNRLEPSLRNENQIDNALRFEIRDPMWMLTRQWQFGEFEAEDAGTAAFVRTYSQQSPITAVGVSASPPQNFDIRKSPLEKPVESEKFAPGVTERLEMGRHWQRILAKRLPAPRATEVIENFRNNARFQFSTELPSNPDRGHQFQHAQKYSDETSLLLIQSLARNRAIDGYALLLQLRSGIAASAFLPAPDTTINELGKEFLSWFARVYGQEQKKSNAWHSQHIEYQPQLAFNDTTGQPLVVKKDEYYGDGLEWHGFTHKSTWDGLTAPNVPAEVPKDQAETVIPSGVRFRGMPSVRLWEMEDGQVDFGSIRASSTELSKMVYAEFGLVFGNDWLIAPVRFAMGNMCRVDKMIVTDNFGKETILKEIAPDGNWAFFQSLLTDVNSHWLFLAAGSELVQESKPVEKVLFLRDEMANMVWGVEEVISNPYGGGRDGEMLAKQTARLVNSLRLSSPADSEGKPPSEGWEYKAGTLMAENRIPFIPVAIDDQQSQTLEKRKVVLQRAATPRVSDDFLPVRIRPRTSLLGYSGKLENQKPDPLFLFEEEIPKTGVELSLVWKRTRWFNGQTHTWLAKKKSVGRGEVDANFRFDTLKNRGK